MPDHTVKAYDDELSHLAADVARMGGLAESEIADSLDIITHRDLSLVQSVIERDLKLDALNAEIERRSIRMIALRQPVAKDLRDTVAAMKIASNLERIGDLAKNISKRGVVLAESEPLTPLTRSIERMGRLVASRLKEVLDAYTSGDLERAIDVWSRDDEIDEHYDSLFRELLTYMMGDPRTITSCAHLLFIAKNLERVGDHATNIAEIVHYQISGEELPTERPKWDSLRQSEKGAAE